MRRDRRALELNNHFTPGRTWAGFNKEETLVGCVMLHADRLGVFRWRDQRSDETPGVVKSETITYATQGQGAVRDWVSLCVYIRQASSASLSCS